MRTKNYKKWITRLFYLYIEVVKFKISVLYNIFRDIKVLTVYCIPIQYTIQYSCVSICNDSLKCT